MAVCYFHPDRPGVGVCVRCRTVICAACSTRLDGINHCHRCLSKLGARTEAEPGRLAPGFVLAALILAVAWLVLLGLFYWAGGAFAPTIRSDAGPGLVGNAHAV